MTFYGRTGDTPVPEGLITVTCRFGDLAVNALKTAPNGNVGMYSGADRPEVFNVKHGKFAVVFDDYPTDSMGIGPAALTSINGIGKTEKEEFPDDEEMQVASLKNRIKPLGITLPGSTYAQEDGNRGSGFVVGISGKFKAGPAICDMPVGMYYKLRPIKPSELRDGSLPVARGDENMGRVRAELVAEPVTPKTFYETSKEAIAHIANYYNNRERYLYCMGKKKKNTDVWASFCKNQGDFAVTCGLHMVHYLIKNGFLAPPMFYFDQEGGVHTNPASESWPESVRFVSRSTPHAPHDVITELMEAAARATGKILDTRVTPEQVRKAVAEAKREKYPTLLNDLRPGLSADVMLKRAMASMGVVNAVHEPEVEDMPPHVMDEMADRAVDFINTVFIRGDVENYEFGFNSDPRIGRTKVDGAVSENLNGKILTNQYSAFRKALASFEDAALSEIQWIGGKITSPGAKGDTWEGVQGKGFL